MLGGKTPSEQYLSKLCEKSFLSLWSFPNIFNDSGVVDGKGDGKEVCDLIVVFGNDVIIFSDKSCEFKDTGRLAIDWNRWYRKAIVKSSNQLYGAERWIRFFPNRLFLDSACTQSFPIEFPSNNKIRVHRISVALGAKIHCQKFYGGGSGSLRISSDVAPVMASDEEFLKAFTIGHFDPEKGYVHVFDDVTLDIVLGELDTVSDFCAYLRKKEELMQKVIVVAGGEEELLGQYLSNMGPDDEHSFGIPDDGYDVFLVPEGIWDDLRTSDAYARKKTADRNSHIWDRLIEYFNRSLKRGDIIEPISVQEYEKGVRRMASLNRTERRMVGRKLKEILETTAPDQTRYSAVLLGQDNSLAFTFVLFPPREDKTYEEYLAVRRELLMAYSNIVRMKNPQVKEGVGLAMEPHKEGRGGSENLAFFDFSEWSEETEKQAKIDSEKLGIKAEATHFSDSEYPAPPAVKLKGNRRARRRRAKLERKKK